MEFHRLALTLAEQELRQRIGKLKEKFGGLPPPVPTDWLSELMGHQVELLEPLEISPRKASMVGGLKQEHTS